MVAAIVKPTLRILGDNPVHDLRQGFFQHLPGAGLGLAQLNFELTPDPFDGHKIGRVQEQEKSRRAPRASTSSAMPATW